jgi:hypothetical protein
MGKNSVTQIAFGRSVEEEYKDNLHNASKVRKKCRLYALYLFLLSFSSLKVIVEFYLQVEVMKKS